MVDAPLGTFSRMRQHEGNEGSGRVGTAVIERRPRRGPRRLRPIDESLLAEAARTRPVGRPGGGGCATPTVELWALHLRYAREHDPADLEALVEEYQDLARSLARRMYRRGEPLDELRQVAMEALVRVLQSFEPERGVPFVGYATPSIVGRLKRHNWDFAQSRHKIGQLNRPCCRQTARREQEVCTLLAREVEQMKQRALFDMPGRKVFNGQGAGREYIRHRGLIELSRAYGARSGARGPDCSKMALARTFRPDQSEDSFPSGIELRGDLRDDARVQ